MIERFSAALKMASGHPEVFVYYSGHGMPGEKEGESYLLPVDADLISLNGSKNLYNLMEDVASSNASRIVFFLDACFTGGGRNGNVLTSSRGIRFVTSPFTVPGRTVVFTAGTAGQSALAYEESSHGLFTYFLLKELRENNKLLNLEELTELVSKDVESASVRISGTLQNPTVRSGFTIRTEWQTWNIKK